jgi:anti-sigma B factor antagonist
MRAYFWTRRLPRCGPARMATAVRTKETHMQIEERIVGDVTILDLKGKMTLGEGDELLKDKINSLIHQGQKNLLLNLEGVPYIDSAGLGEIVRTYTTVSRQGGALKLVNLTKRITDLLSITKLLTVFETFDLEKDAVASFQPSAKA